MRAKNEMEFAKKVEKDLMHLVPVTDGKIEILENPHAVGLSFRSAASGKDGFRADIELNLVNSYYQYRNGLPYDEVLGPCIDEVWDQIDHKLAAGPVDWSKLDQWDTAKDQIVMELENRDYYRNELDSIPYRDLGNACIIYKAVFLHEYYELDGCLIANSDLEMYHITPEQLHQQALISTPKLRPAVFKHVTDLAELLTVEGDAGGAAAVFYPGILERCGEEMNGNFYLMALNVQMILLVRDNGDKTMIRKTIGSIGIMYDVFLSEEDRLDRSIYYYDAAAHTLKPAELDGCRTTMQEVLRS